MSGEIEPLFPMRLPVIVLTGKHGAGKSIFGLSICKDPSQTCYYDFEFSATTYNLPGLARVNVPEEMQKATEGSYNPQALWKWWVKDMRERLVPGKYRVAMLDTINELEVGCADWVRANPEVFHATANVYEKMAGVMWGHVKQVWKRILAEMASRVECVVLATHMGKVWSDNKPTSQLKGKGLDTLQELASLYLQLRRDIQPNGEYPRKPDAIVLKSRLARMVLDEATGEWNTEPVLTPVIPDATPASLRAAMQNPFPVGKKLAAKYLAIPEKASEEEMARIRLETAENEAEANRLKLQYLERIEASRSAQAIQALSAAQAESKKQAAQMQQELEAMKDLEASLPDLPDLPEMPPEPQDSSGSASSGEELPELPSEPVVESDGPVAEGCLMKSQRRTLLGLRDDLQKYGMPASAWPGILARRGVSSVDELKFGAAAELIAILSRQLAGLMQQKGSAAGDSKS